MTQKHHWVRPSLPAWVAVITAVTVLFTLGFWQVRRLGEKEALIAQIETAAARAPEKGFPPTDAPWQSLGFSRYRVSGVFLHKKELHLTPRYYRSALGYHILTPLRLEDGRVLLVNRGWVPAAKKNPDSRPESHAMGTQTLTVMLRTDRDHTAFTPEHDTRDNIWFWRDIPAMRKATGLDLLPVTADVVATTPPARDTLPIASDGTLPLRNDHLGYAITWFLIGLSAAAVFACYHRRPGAF
jgi:surfeit locus 1 family protein